MKTKKAVVASFIFLTILGIFLRLWHIEFGLPHSFYADEPEIAELAIKYTYELKSIFSDGEFYKLIPVSYVYGTFPSYLFTIFTMGFSKASNILGLTVSKPDLYVGMRTFNALLSFLIVPIIALLTYRTTKKVKLSLLIFLLLALNWKLIVHAHYLNPDIILTLLLSLSFLATHYFLQRKHDTIFTLLAGISFGLAVGTKITALISLPLFIWIFYFGADDSATNENHRISDKTGRFKNIAGFIFTALGTFMISNPFSFIFAQDFFYRIYEMMFKEGGLVFDSVDYGLFKYFSALTLMCTSVLSALAVLGIFSREKYKFNMFLALNVFFYLIFFSVQSRRVDRWVLPVMPLVFYFAVLGLDKVKNRAGLKPATLILIPTILYYLYFPAVLMTQFQRWTPKSEAYLWMQKNTPELSTKLVYTEEGLDPMNKLPQAKVYQYEVYSSKNAGLFYPKDPAYFDYVVISSRPIENHRKIEVRKSYPDYATRWDIFEQKLNDPKRFELIKDFTLSKPNLIPLSDVFVYKNLAKLSPPLSGPIPFITDSYK